MTRNDHRKIRKIIAVLKVYRDVYAGNDNTVIASKFARVIALLMEILQEEPVDAERGQSM